MPEKFPTHGVKSIAQIRGNPAAINPNIPGKIIFLGIKPFDFLQVRYIFIPEATSR